MSSLQWTLRLIRDKGLFSKDATFESTNGPIDFDSSHSYVGTVLGEFCQNTLSFDLPNDTLGAIWILAKLHATVQAGSQPDL
ncbi:hypothetical protein K0M31_006424 [Melipona bicolor]|uniref:Uncharacterized protein n=1 Tax=Melipona bicolor TaxID=60889 RepID=A0AA40FTI6_9HYME|nr:hypothetical protein K0M31_006424 [Melipona bicolor]